MKILKFSSGKEIFSGPPWGPWIFPKVQIWSDYAKDANLRIPHVKTSPKVFSWELASQKCSGGLTAPRVTKGL